MRLSAVSTNQSCPASRNAENAVSLAGYNDADAKRKPPWSKLSESKHGYYIILRRDLVYDGTLYNFARSKLCSKPTWSYSICPRPMGTQGRDD
jgi:hypothetical protein